jgi:hypothetical protein
MVSSGLAAGDVGENFILLIVKAGHEVARRLNLCWADYTGPQNLDTNLSYLV